MARPPTVSMIRLPVRLSEQAPLDGGPVALGQFDGVGAAEEVRGVQQVDVERVALDPLAAVEEAAQGGDPVVHRRSAGVLHRRAGAHLVGDRADAADARRDVRRLAGTPPLQHGLEEPGRLEDGEGDVPDDAVAHLDAERSLALDPGQALHGHGAVRTRSVGHEGSRLSVGVGRFGRFGQRGQPATPKVGSPA